MDEHRQTTPNEHRHYPEDEIELMDYLLVIWKWKYLILTGTMAFALTAAIISFISWKQQPTMYRTNIVLKPGILKIDKNGKKVYIDSPENIKALIENDLKYKVLEQINNSNNTKLSTALDFQIDIPKGSNIINVSLISALADEGTTKLNYLIKALLQEEDMEQIEIADEAQTILKSGIALKEKLLTVKAENYFKRLKSFEKKHNMKSAEFFKAFTAGKLGDDAEWFDWIFVYEA